MSDRTNEELRPLGEPTPAPATRPSRRWGRQTAVVAAAALVLGAVAGFALAQVLDTGGASEESADDGRGVRTTVPRTTTTVEIIVPSKCREAMRSAEQALALLEQGLQSLRTFAVAEIESVLTEMQRLRSVLSGRVRECLEQA